MQATRTLKVVLIGDGDAGKTSLRQRYLTDRFQHAYRATIGADFVSKTVEVNVPSPERSKRKGKSNEPASDEDVQPSSNGQALASASVSSHTQNVRVTLSIWDTAGQERFRSLGTAFYRGADAVILAFDVTKRGALQRTLSWYKDFCSMGGLGLEGDEEEQRMSPKQLRVVRERRERFCWVAVGCKADLLANERTLAKSESSFEPTSSREARKWFEDILPRYVPEGQKEQDVDDTLRADKETDVRPYTIDGEAPALPEDVLSRPSPKNHHASLLPHNSNESSQSRHPDAGTPPGEAVKPGSGSLLRRQSSTQHLARQTAVLPIDNPRGRPSVQLDGQSQTSLSSSSLAQGTVRSRYDSAVSTSGQSVYYSLKGSTMYSQSPAGRSHSTSTTGRHANGASSSGSLRSGSAGVTMTDSDDEADTVQGASVGSDAGINSRPRLRKVFSDQSDATATAGTSKATGPTKIDGSLSDVEDADEDEIRPRRVAPTVPSGEPIPFPTEEDDDISHDINHTVRSTRYSRTSSRRHSRRLSSSQSRGESQVANISNAEIIAEQVKHDRETQGDESTAEGDRRATLYSARPSSCNSTIRPADADLEHESVNVTRQDGDDDEADGDLPDDEHEGLSRFYEDQIEQGFRLFYTSAKDGTSVDHVFEHIARRVAIRWTYEEWEESQRREIWGYDPHGEVRTAPPTDEDTERERMRRAIKISQGKSVGGCCS